MTNDTPPAAARRHALLPARELATFFSGGPSLLVSTGLVRTGAPDFGLDTILAAVGNSDIRFYRDADAARSGGFVEAPALPSDLLAIVAAADDAAALCALWTERGQEPPPTIVVDDLEDAVGPVLACASAEIARLSARCADLQRALVATRAEFEETRVAMQGAMRTLSHRYATKMNLVAVAAPAQARTIALAPQAPLRSVYPVGTELVTCLALHVAAPPIADAVLKLTLLGAESGRALGEWRRPGAALSAGWSMFDLPVPVAAARESIAVEVALDGPGDATLSLSLSDDPALDGEAPLAIRIWTAEAGGRFPHAEHWMWHRQGMTRPAAGTVSLVAAGTLARIVARGGIEAVREQAASGTGLHYLLRGGASLLCLSDLSIADAEGISIELERGFGDLGDARFEIAVQSPQDGFGGGWRSFSDTDGTLRLGLSLPSGLPDTVDLYLRIEDGERSEQAPAGIALSRIEIVAGRRVPLELGLRTVRIDPEALPPRAGPAGPRFGSLRAANYNETDTYALFEVVIEGLAFGDRLERQVKFKLSKANGRLTIEFRQNKNWPRIFREWPGRGQDHFGDVFRVADNERSLMIMGELAPGEDSDLLAALFSLMPAVVAAGIQAFPGAAEQTPDWTSAARSFAEAARRSFA